jgi:hypothetical protein
VAHTAPVVKVEIHPYSGAITVTTGEWGGRGPVVLIEQDGRISYDQVADTAARREAQA